MNASGKPSGTTMSNRDHNTNESAVIAAMKPSPSRAAVAADIRGKSQAMASAMTSNMTTVSPVAYAGWYLMRPSRMPDTMLACTSTPA